MAPNGITGIPELSLNAAASDIYALGSQGASTVAAELAVRPPFQTGAGLDWSNLLVAQPSLDVRPFVALLINADATVSASYGKLTLTGANITKVGAGQVAYRVTFDGQSHPKGTSFVPACQIRTNTTADLPTLADLAIATSKNEGSTAMSFWFRSITTAGAFTTQNFYCWTIP